MSTEGGKDTTPISDTMLLFSPLNAFREMDDMDPLPTTSTETCTTRTREIENSDETDRAVIDGNSESKSIFPPCPTSIRGAQDSKSALCVEAISLKTAGNFSLTNPSCADQARDQYFSAKSKFAFCVEDTSIRVPDSSSSIISETSTKQPCRPVRVSDPTLLSTAPGVESIELSDDRSIPLTSDIVTLFLKPEKEDTNQDSSLVVSGRPTTISRNFGFEESNNNQESMMVVIECGTPSTVNFDLSEHDRDKPSTAVPRVQFLPPETPYSPKGRMNHQNAPSNRTSPDLQNNEDRNATISSSPSDFDSAAPCQISTQQSQKLPKVKNENATASAVTSNDNMQNQTAVTPEKFDTVKMKTNTKNDKLDSESFSAIVDSLVEALSVPKEEVSLTSHETFKDIKLSDSIGNAASTSSVITDKLPEKFMLERVNASQKTKQSYTCEICARVFHRLIHLEVHMRRHTGEKPFKCDLCEKSFTINLGLQRHMMCHSDEKKFCCQDCGKRFSRWNYLKTHLRTHTGERPYSCTRCGHSFTQLGALKSHRRIHTGEKPYSCEHCGRSFSEPGALKMHVRIHTGEKPYICMECGKCFRQSSNLKSHMLMHTNERTRSCRKYDPYNWQSHLKILTTGQKVYVCNSCGKTFPRTHALKRHMMSHTGEKPFECTKCTKRFSQYSNLQTHMKTHTDEKRHICVECGKNFAQSCNLRTHMLIHANVKPYSCTQCGKKFSQLGNLKMHMRTHTGERPHMCIECGRSFAQLGNLKTHQKTHLK